MTDCSDIVNLECVLPTYTHPLSAISSEEIIQFKFFHIFMLFSTCICAFNHLLLLGFAVLLFPVANTALDKREYLMIIFLISH